MPVGHRYGAISFCLLFYCLVVFLLVCSGLVLLLLIFVKDCSARAALVATSFYMKPVVYAQFRLQVPHLSWFKTQRKGLGYEAWLYAMVRVAKCECCLQLGFDETSIDGVPTLNQWVLLQEDRALPTVCTIECAGILVGSTSQDHISQSWSNGQTAVGLLRYKLEALAGIHVPLLVNGGVLLHKLQAVMHDTCNTANKVARLAKELRDASGQLHFAYDEWERIVAENKPWFDFLCANHARNLPMDELTRLFQIYITNELGDAMKAIQVQSSGRSRVEATGILVLRSLCRLTHIGHAQYALGDGIAFGDYLKRCYPNLKSRCVGPAENSKRQDWSCEASWNLFNLVGPIMQYTVETLQLGPSILRDLVSTRVQDQRFEAFVHANSILLKVVFHELRALTNTTKICDAGLGVNPLEIYDIMDHLWNVAVVLQTNEAL
jgi:hypothetical protein